MMTGSNYHVSYLQILESERGLKVSNILRLFSNQNDSSASLQESSFNHFHHRIAQILRVKLTLILS